MVRGIGGEPSIPQYLEADVLTTIHCPCLEVHEVRLSSIPHHRPVKDRLRPGHQKQLVP